MTRCAFFLAGGAALTLAVPATAADPAASPPTRTIQATAGDLLVLADQFIKRGRRDQAGRILALISRDPNADVRSEARYRQAVLLETEGHRIAAAMLLRRILDDRPGAAAVRLKLATMLQAMGDEESALRELRALKSADLPPTVARFVDRLSASLTANKPFGVQVELALAPDSNINRATRSDTLGTILGDFTLDEGAKAKSGIGAAVRAMAHARFGLSGDFGLTARASGDANLYRHKDFNDISVDVAAGPEWRHGRIRLNADVGAGQQWYGMKPYQRSLRLNAAAVAPVGQVTQIRVDVSARRVDNRLNDLQDGRGLSARFRLERALSPRLLIAASLAADRFKAHDDGYSTRSWQAGIAAYRELGPLTVSLGAEIGHLNADRRLLLFAKARSDRLTRLTIGTVFRRLGIAGFAPMTRLVIERNRSTVGFYDYRRIRTEFGITRAF